MQFTIICIVLIIKSSSTLSQEKYLNASSITRGKHLFVSVRHSPGVFTFLLISPPSVCVSICSLSEWWSQVSQRPSSGLPQLPAQGWTCPGHTPSSLSGAWSRGDTRLPTLLYAACSAAHTIEVCLLSQSLRTVLRQRATSQTSHLAGLQLRK